MERAVLLLQCPDTKGIVARLSDFVFRHDGNIVNLDQYTTDPTGGRFFLRLEFDFDPAQMPREQLDRDMAPIVAALEGTGRLHYRTDTLRMGILVSKYDHCLYDLLYRRRAGELTVSIPFVISNHEDCRGLVEAHGIPFHHVPLTRETRLQAEQQMLELSRESTDFLVLARYMQIISDGFLAAYKKDIINIHHSFLPSFKGANPYRQAYERGVKVIGATAHFVTRELDEGPIIEQLVDRVYFKDTVEALMRKGRNLEKQTLANAVQAYVEHRIIRDDPKTIVF